MSKTKSLQQLNRFRPPDLTEIDSSLFPPFKNKYPINSHPNTTSFQESLYLSMMQRYLLFLVVCVVICSNRAWSQFSSMRQKTVSTKQLIIDLDSLSIAPNSLIIRCESVVLLPSSYSIDYATAQLKLLTACSDSVTVNYRVLPIDFNRTYSKRDTSQIYSLEKGDREKYLIQPTAEPFDLLGTSGLRKSGSISRGIAFGNRQDLSVNSSLNLELSGYISPNLQVLASVTDDNLPIQPEGNTNKLQEFDQIFIQIFNEQFKLTAGDFWISKPEGYFLTYKKRGQGLTGEYFWRKDAKKTIRTQASGAFSKGKFNRQIIPGIEGNQGPYRLRGNENEPFIVVLSGTERVYIDGKLLARGQEYDYVIDYNSSELTFTARNLITKDVRIVVEFQYSDQNYARSLFQFSTSSTSKKVDWWVNAYSEQDAKNQPLQQNLSNDQKFLLSKIGDSLELARSTTIDSVGYSENLVLYQLKDSLGFDSVLVVSVDPNLAVYRVVYSFVGAGKGDYVFEKFNALGRVYKWVQPQLGVSVGDYAPVSLLISPKKQQLFTAGTAIRLTDRLKFSTEIGRSGFDLNTFSTLDRFDDVGYSLRANLEQTKPFGKDTVQLWSWNNKLEIETLDPYFKPIEQYRAVEFDRDWNTRDQKYAGNQLFTTLSSTIKHATFGQFGIGAQQYKIGDDFGGIRAQATSNWNQNGIRILGDASILNATSSNKNQFVRHKLDVSKQIKKIRLGFKDDQENNQFYTGDTLLSVRSYSFFDYQGYAAFGDTASGEFQISYRERIDGRSDSTSLQRAAKAQTFSAQWEKKNWKNQRLLLVANYRVLSIKNPKLIAQQPENTTNGRVDHDIKFWKNSVNLTTFYEVGAGLDQRREFLYIKVNDGQGVYTWIDYNGDNVKDLNEFEIAAYADQASYIRVFTPSNDYIKTYSNEFNQSLSIRPERIWSNATGIKKFVARFSTQSRFRIQRKTTLFDGIKAYNPFISRLNDAEVLSSSSAIKQSVYFNRVSSIFGADYNFQTTQTKTLLATGFDGRNNQSHEVNFRVNIKKEFSVLGSYERGLKTSFVDYTTGRNYRLNYWIVKPSLVFQPNTSLRFSLDARLSAKKNAIDFGGETATLKDLGLSAKYNQAQKGSLQGQINFIQIDFIGNSNSPLGFELLEALKPGKNIVWNVGYQRTVSKNLQISFQYNGRQSVGTKTIHAGGMELKAFF